MIFKKNNVYAKLTKPFIKGETVLLNLAFCDNSPKHSTT